MKKQIVKVSLVQSGKVIALMYVLLSLPIIGLMMAFAPSIPGIGSKAVLLGVPIFYAVISFVGTVLGGWLYNLAAGMVGGIEYTTSDV